MDLVVVSSLSLSIIVHPSHPSVHPVLCPFSFYNALPVVQSQRIQEHMGTLCRTRRASEVLLNILAPGERVKVARTLLGAPGLTTRSKDATRSIGGKAPTALIPKTYPKPPWAERFQLLRSRSNRHDGAIARFGRRG